MTKPLDVSPLIGNEWLAGALTATLTKPSVSFSASHLYACLVLWSLVSRAQPV